MRIIVFILSLMFAGIVSEAGTVQCVGIGLVAEIGPEMGVVDQEIGPDFVVTEFSSETGNFSMYVGFYPWVEMGPDAVKRMELETRHQFPLIVVHSGDDESDYLDIVLIMERRHGKTSYLHLTAPGRGFDDRKPFTNFLLNVRYSPAECPPGLGGDLDSGENGN